MAALFYSFPPDEWRRIFPTQPFLLQILKTIPGCQNIVLRKDSHTLIFCGDTSAEFYFIDGGGHVAQNNGCPHFCDSIINISIKSHIFYQTVFIHMQKILHSWYWSDIFVSVDKVFWQLLNFFLDICDWFLRSYLFWYLPQLGGGTDKTQN